MHGHIRTVLLQRSRLAAANRTLAAGMILGLIVSCAPSRSGELDLLLRDAQGPTQATQNHLTSTPSFIRTQISLVSTGFPAGTNVDVGRAFLNRYAGLFGIEDASQDLLFVAEQTDRLGMRHVTFKQVYRGVEVYGARATVHLSRDGSRVVAVTNSIIPQVAARLRRPRIDAARAVRAARRRMPGANVVSATLMHYPGLRRQSTSRLAWLVELRDDALPARRTYVVSARDSSLLDVLDRLYTGRDRRTHSANHGFDLPGALRRAENDAPVGDPDLDRVHDFAGETYDYFSETFGRDSYDNLGAIISSTAHFRADYQNAFWDGLHMVYGDGYTVKDVVAHEMTHAVTEHSANLEYRWQSGALNESFSDIFGAMVDRDDWLIGDDLPNGPIRNMADPTQFNDPGHVSDWRAVCSDNEGVHTNSGIHNRAFVGVAEAIGKDRAERIFYRALTVYLGSQSSFEDSRSGALQSAADLFGDKAAEVQAVDNGFAAVGIDGAFDPGPGGCASASSEADSRETLWAALALMLGLLGLGSTLRRTYWS